MINLDIRRDQDLRPIKLSNNTLGSIIRIDGDGNCLFKAIAERCRFLEMNIPDFAKDPIALRNKVVEELNKTTYRQAIAATLSLETEVNEVNITDADVKNYISKMANSGTWGGSPEIISVSNILKIRILVHKNGQIIKMPQGREYDKLPELIEIVHEPLNSGIGDSFASGQMSNNHYNLAVENNLSDTILRINKITTYKNTHQKSQKPDFQNGNTSFLPTQYLDDNILDPTFNQNQSDIEPVTSSGVMNSEMKKAKVEDLNALREISSLINTFLSYDLFSNEVVESLVQIGILAGSLNYNDTGDDKNEYIRNKYGSIDRSHDAKRREGGLEIIQLAALEKIANKISKEIGNAAFFDLKAELTIIKSKIELIVVAETDLQTKNLEDVFEYFQKSPSTIKFCSFVSYFYSKEIVEELINLLKDDELPKLDFMKRADRYYFGRVLSLIGELSKDFKDFINPGKESGLFSFFKKIRDSKIAHSYSAMVFDIDNKEEQNLRLLMTVLTINFRKILENILQTLITSTTSAEGNSLDPFTSWSNIKKCAIKLGMLNDEQKIQLKKLLKNIFEKGEEDLDKDILNNIMMVTAAFEEKEHSAKEDRKTTKKCTVVRNAITSMDNILRKLKKIQELQAKKNKEKQIAQITSEIQMLIVGYNKAVIHYDDLQIPNENVQPTEELLDEIKLKLIKSEVAISEVEKQTKEKEAQLDEELDDNKKTNSKNKNEKTPKNEKETKEHIRKNISKTLDIILKELDYIMIVIKDQSISERKRTYIIEFGLTKLGQIFKDIEIKERELLADLVHNDFHESLNVTENIRNKLMHDMLSRKKLPDLSKILHRYTLPIIPEVEALKKIFLAEKVEESLPSTSQLDLLFELGRAYISLKQYQRAIEIFNNMLRLSDIKIILTDEDFLFDLEGTCNAYLGLSLAYGAAANDEMTKGNETKRNEFLHLKITYLNRQIQLLLIHPEGLQSHLASRYNNIANTFSDIGEYKKSIDYHKKAILTLHQCGIDSKDREALYLSNLGITYTIEHNKDINKPTNAQEMSQLREQIKKMHLAVACLWEAKEQHVKTWVLKNDYKNIHLLCILIRALLSTTEYRNYLFAKELYSELKTIVSLFNARESSYEIEIFNTLTEVMNDVTLLINNKKKIEHENTEKRFKNEREIVDIEFELERLGNLGMFYMEIGLEKNLDDRIAIARRKLAQLDPKKRSLESLFNAEVGILTVEATQLFICKKFKEALTKYLQALQKLNSTKEYKEIIPEVLGDLLVSIADTYAALEMFEPALRNYHDALCRYLEYTPKDGAFHIPHKIVKMNNNLFKNHNDKNLEMTENALNDFKIKVGNNDSRLNTIKKLLAAIHFNKGEYDITIKYLKEMDEMFYDSHDRELLDAASKLCKFKEANNVSQSPEVKTEGKQATVQKSISTGLFNNNIIETRIIEQYNAFVKKYGIPPSNQNMKIKFSNVKFEIDNIKIYLLNKLELSPKTEYDHNYFIISIPVAKLQKLIAGTQAQINNSFKNTNVNPINSNRDKKCSKI